jgi:MFS family permease
VVSDRGVCSRLLRRRCAAGCQRARRSLLPTSLRSTGIGWSLGIGRIGSVIGPLVGGQLIALNWSNASLFRAAAVPVLCSAVLVIALAGAARCVDARRGLSVNGESRERRRRQPT